MGPSSPSNPTTHNTHFFDPIHIPSSFDPNLFTQSNPTTTPFDPNLKFPTIIHATYQPPTNFSTPLFHQPSYDFQQLTPSPQNHIFTSQSHKTAEIPTALQTDNNPNPVPPTHSKDTDHLPHTIPHVENFSAETTENMKFAKLMGINENDCALFIAKTGNESGVVNGVTENGAK